MSKKIVTGALAVLLGAATVQAATLEISIAAQGAAYNNMVADAKLRGDNGLMDWNLGAASGDSNRFYANYLPDGMSPSGRQNTFLQRFDVSGIPPGALIKSATLTQYFANQTANNRTFEGIKLSQLRPGKGWVETLETPPGFNGPHFDGSVTWNSQISPTTPWSVTGATGDTDIFLDTTKTFNLVGVDGTASTIVADITSWVQDWVNNPPNNTGMLWWGGNSADSDSGNRYFRFGTKEDGAGPASDSASAAPTLVIEYTTGPAAPVLTSVNRTGDTFSVSFTSETGVNYKLQYNDSLAEGGWSDGLSITGDGNVRTLSDVTTRAVRFYRVLAF